MDSTAQTFLEIFVVVVAISFLVQACFTVAIFVGARKTQKKLVALADDVRLHALPVIMSSRDVLQEITPKVKIITENLAVTSETLRRKTDQIGGVVSDVTNRAHVQASRVDGMVKGTLDGLTSAVQAIEHGVAVPVRQVNGILNGLRAGVDVLMKKTPTNHRDPDQARDSEGDLFV
jgi:hypothetical protein